MYTQTIQALELRNNLGEFLERVYYQTTQFRIQRKNRPMARLVSEPYMTALEQLILNDPSLADTLAVLMNDEAMRIIQAGDRELQAGQRISLAQALTT